MEPTPSDARLSSKIDELKKFYLKCLNKGSYVQTKKE